MGTKTFTVEETALVLADANENYFEFEQEKLSGIKDYSPDELIRKLTDLHIQINDPDTIAVGNFPDGSSIRIDFEDSSIDLRPIPAG